MLTKRALTPEEAAAVRLIEDSYAAATQLARGA